MQKQAPSVKNATAAPTTKTNKQGVATEGQKYASETTQEKACTNKVTPLHQPPSSKHGDEIPPAYDDNVHDDGGDLRPGSDHDLPSVVAKKGMTIGEGELCQPSSTHLENGHAADNDDHGDDNDDDDDFPLSGQVSGPCEDDEENKAEISSVIDEEEEIFMHKPRPNR